MIQTLPKRLNAENDELDLPAGRFAILHHLKNIEYCIAQITAAHGESNMVIGYTEQIGVGVVEVNHRLLMELEAKTLKESNPRFNYVTLDELLAKKKDIMGGKYILSDGLIIDNNPD